MTLDDAAAYHFELQFRLPKDQKIWSEDAEVVLGSVLGNDRLSLKTRDGRRLREATDLSLLGLGYETAEQAHVAAERARHALVLAGIESGIAIEWCDEPPRQPGGLSIWKGYGAAIVEAGIDVSASLPYMMNADAFRQRLIPRLASAAFLSSEQHACVELLRGFEFDQNARSRLILAIAAIERLAARPLLKSGEHQRAIAILVKTLAETVVEDSNIKKELEGSLKGLAYLSVRGRCLRLVEMRLGEAGVREFQELSDFRHKVAHEGTSGGEGWNMAFRAFDLARRLLFADVAASGQSGAGVGK